MSRVRPPANSAIVVLVTKLSTLPTFVLHEFLELRRQGLPVRLVALRDPAATVRHAEAVPLLDEVTYLHITNPRRGLGAIRHAMRHHPRGLRRGLMWLARQRNRADLFGLMGALAFVRFCDEEGVRHVHAHFTLSMAVAHLSNLIAGIPYTVTGHAIDIYTRPPGLLAARLSQAQVVVTCTDANRTYLEQVVGVPPEHVRVLRHGIPLQSFLDVHRAPVPGRLLTVARLVPKKGHDVIARALAQLVARGRDVHWAIAGSGPELDSLQRLVSELGLTERVSFLGFLTSDEVRAELAQAEAFVLAPRVLVDGDRDGIPNVLLEAMAAGVPVVTTAVSGVPEVISDEETGLLVVPDNPTALALAIARLLDDAALADQLAVQARTWANEHCDLERSVAPLAGVFRALCPELPPPLAARPSAISSLDGR